VSDSATPWTAARQASLSFTISLSLLKLTSIESVMASNHLILFHPLLFPQVAHQHISSKHNKTKLSPKRIFKPAAKRKKNPKHSLSYYTNFYCLNVVSLPTSFSAAFLWNYSMAFSRWENPRSRRKTYIISIHKLIRAPTETVLIIYLQKH